MSEAPGKIILHCNKDGKWDRIPVANGCSASTEPLVPDVSDTEEFRRAAAFRKTLLQCPIHELKKWCAKHKGLFYNNLCFSYGLELPWSTKRYYMHQHYGWPMNIVRYPNRNFVRSKRGIRFRLTGRFKLPGVTPKYTYRIRKKYGL